MARGRPPEPRVAQGWQSALAVLWPDLLWSRVALVAVGFIALAFFPWMYVSPTYNLSRDPLILMFTRWDAMWYIDIARRGYWFKALAFFPLYPAAIAGIRWLTGASAAWSALVISNGALVASVLVFWRLVREYYGQKLASRTTRLFLLFPTAFFLSAAYTESLFLLGVLLTFWWAGPQKRIWAAGIAAFFAALTRNQGVLLVVPLAGAYWHIARASRAAPGVWRWVRLEMLAVAMPVAGILLFAGWQALVFHRADAFLAVQAAWGRALAPPWVGMVAAVDKVLAGGPLQAPTILSIMDLLAALGFLGLLAVGMRQRLPWTWLAYAAGAWLMDVSAPALGGESPLLSMTRLVLVLFPGFVSLAMLVESGKQPEASAWRAGTVGTMWPWVLPMLQAMFFAIFATWRWVA